MHVPSVAPSAVVTTTGLIESADARFAELLELPAYDLKGRQIEEFGAEAIDTLSITDCVRVSAHGAAGHVRVELRTARGRALHVQLIAIRIDGVISVAMVDETNRVLAERGSASSERRWLSLLRNSADIIFTTSSEGILTSVTSALPRQLGWAVEDVIGRPGLSFVHPDDQEAGDAAWIAVVSGHSPQTSLEIRLVHANDSVTWARLVITDLRDDPDVRAVVGNVTDINEQKAEEARRLHEETRFRTRFEQSRLPQTMQAPDGTFEAVNDAFCTLVGRTRDELVGTRPQAIAHPDDPHQYESAMDLMLRRGVDSAQTDRMFQDPEGRPVPVRVDVTMLRDAEGRPNGFAASIQDLRPLRDSELARVQLQDFFDVVAERSRDFVALHDRDGNTVYASPAGRRLFGEAYRQKDDEQMALVHPDDLDRVSASWQHVSTHNTSLTWRFRARDVQGEWIWVEQTSTNLLDTSIGGILSSLRDVTAEVEVEAALRHSEARYRAMAETAEEGIVVISPDGRVTYANARLATMMGLPLAHMIGVEVWSVLRGEARTYVAERVGDRAQRGSERYEVPYDHPDGTRRILWVAASPMPDVDGQPQGSLAMISDVTESRRGEDELRRAAQHDHLTGLPNRTMLMNHLQHLGLPEAPGTAVLFVDLDHFKDVNDGRGHTAGDSVLIEVAKRLTSTVRPSDVVARFGGDEFVVVLHDVDDDAARAAGERLLEVLSNPYGIGHHAIRIGATIGIALSPASTAEDLLRFADTAMYAAKAGGRGRVRLFDRALSEQAEERYVLGAELLTAIATDGLDMNYQPVVDVSTGEVVGVEALARWNHPTRGEIKPARFVSLAELNASATDLDRWVIQRAMRDVAELKADLTMPDDAYVAINLSGQSLADGLDRYIVACAAEAGIDPGVVMLEITESAIMADKDVAIAVLQRLRDHGFDIAIDDFGTGYSSMVYLRDLPITVLKIDRGFVRGIPDDAHSLAIVTSLIELARALDLKVVAEGVETIEHLDALRSRGCGLAQGWFWSAALSPAELRSSRILTDRFDTVEGELGSLDGDTP